MLATIAWDQDLTGGGWRYEPKLDGWRLVSVDGKVTVRTRTGRDVTGSLLETAAKPRLSPPWSNQSRRSRRGASRPAATG